MTMFVDPIAYVIIAAAIAAIVLTIIWITRSYEKRKVNND